MTFKRIAVDWLNSNFQILGKKSSQDNSRLTNEELECQNTVFHPIATKKGTYCTI